MNEISATSRPMASTSSRLSLLLRTLVVTVLVLAGPVIVATPANAETRVVLGSANFNVYCNAKYSVPLIARYGKADLFGRDVTKWRCVVHEWVGRVSGIWLGWALVGIYGIDVNAACRTQFRRSDARASYRNFWDPYSWYCYYPIYYYA